MTNVILLTQSIICITVVSSNTSSENCRAGKFETEEELAAKLAEMKVAEEQKAQDVDKNLGKFKGKKTKLVAKTGKKKQWEIMEAMKVPLDEIPKFVDAEYWLE